MSNKKSWLYSWGGNIPESQEMGSASDDERGDNTSGTNSTTNASTKLSGDVSEATPSAESETNPKQPSQATPAEVAPSDVPRKTSPRQPQTQLAATDSHKALRHKASTASLGSYATSSWLGWSTKGGRSSSVPEEGAGFEGAENQDDVAAEDVEEAVDEDESGENFRKPHSPSAESQRGSSPGSSSVLETAGTAEDSEAQKGKKSWGFWNSDEAGKRDVSHKITNTILKSTPSIPSRKDLSKDPESFRDNESQKAQKIQSAPPSKPDDAVLYKPHHSAKEFSRIDTHKNENITQNVLVPNWDTCLQAHDPSNLASTTSNLHSGTGLKPQAFDLKSWRAYLSQISTRLGFTSSTENDTSSNDSSESTSSNMEDELHHLHERSYKLYGKSLSRLPPHKRACLPNLNKYYTSPAKKAKTQIEEDSTSENPVSITNDAEGNLLINYREKQGDICSQKVGPLQKINKILIIGVHGFFPTRMIRPLIGAPTGTSSKFANEAEKAVIRYLLENDMMSDDESQDVSIQKIALEKEGKIFDRVEFFLRILTRWEQELNEADVIFVASHSQGCVVSIMLLAKLIKQGILKNASQKRIGILGMAGVNNGPFYGIDKSLFMKAYSAIEHDSMTELFELTKFDSAQSLAYKDAMQTVISMNVKLCLVGSINDQLVPLYSALASHIFHPNIYRACYIDSSSKTPAFIKTLISFCCQMQNMGYFDNNVIKEISPILAGSMTGGGHSKIYNDGKVYDLGIKFMLDTDDLVIPKIDEFQSDELDDMPVTNKVYVKEYNIGKIGTNPYILPWCLRGLIFNVQKNWRPVNAQITTQITTQLDAVHKSGAEEIDALYESFDNWRPETKALKDLKFRLNGIRASKL